MITAQAFSTIQAIERSAWNDCFPEALEDWDYYLAVEKAAIADFRWRYLAVYEGSTLVAVAPLRLYAIGSPVAEQCNAGTASHVPSERRQALLDELLKLARADADSFGIGLMAVKDAPSHDRQWTASCLAAGLQAMPSLPSALLPIPYASIDAYLGTLGKSTRKDLRRKLRAPGPRIEWRQQIDDVLPDIMRLYEATLNRADLQFERLPADYFTGILDQLGERAACVLYWVGEQLVAFNLVLVDQHRLIDKFFAHDLDVSREHNLYFRSWLANVDHCIQQRIPLYECGQAGYASKLRLGCRFTANMLFFRHRNPLLNAALKVIKRFVRPDRSDPAMAAAISEST
ncbi:hypothetical protein AO265_34820 [Pseudomonas sp. ABAC61]|nr:hypothetical protein AO265_34820 [Pseudomonas sp. ABAC61]